MVWIGPKNRQADMKNKQRQRSSGFTLIEILVVIIIITILAGIVSVNVFSQPDKAKVSVASHSSSILLSDADVIRAVATKAQRTAAVVAEHAPMGVAGGSFEIAVLNQLLPGAVRVANHAHVVHERLARIDGVQGTSTHFFLRAYKKDGVFVNAEASRRDQPSVSP